MNALLVVLAIITVILLGPLIAIASLNTLSDQANMGFHFPHNAWTYLSVYGLMLVFLGGSK